MVTITGHKVGCEFHPDTFTPAELAKIESDIKVAKQGGYCAICGGAGECKTGCVMRHDTFTEQEHSEIQANIECAQAEGRCALCGGVMQEVA